jgi:hypothetical protein
MWQWLFGTEESRLEREYLTKLEKAEKALHIKRDRMLHSELLTEAEAVGVRRDELRAKLHDTGR